ncbi:MAG: glycosyl transferase [Deltaproteobacteria bacterium]|nr:glycosyl transferase [Deltaproteobacteria bacterium]
MAFWALAVPAIALGSALTTAALIHLLRPTLARYALARPNVRSSHRIPTPQGGGIAIVATSLGATILVSILVPTLAHAPSLAVLLSSTAVLAIVGAADDIVTLRAMPRLACQLIVAAAVIWTIPAELRVVAWLPFLIERVLVVVAITWFINLVNFMDGIDWITVAGVLPVCAGICTLGVMGEAPAIAAVIALAIGGSTVGFAPFNRPVAKLFLGDVGSLPIGLLLGWLLVLVAGSGHLAAAILLPLYHVADATITLARRAARHERIWEAHRTHFYQRATDRGFTVIEIVTRVFVVNLILLGFALLTVVVPSRTMSITALCCGVLVVLGLLRVLSRGPR